MLGRKSVLKKSEKSLDEVPSPTLPSLRQVFSSPKYIANLVLRSGHTEHPISESVYGVMAQSLTVVLKETRGAQSGKRNGITDPG